MNLLPFLFAMVLPASLMAAAPTPLPPTTDLLLERPVAGETDYVDRLNRNADTLDAAVLDKRVGGTIDGDLIVTGSIIGDASLLIGVPSGVNFVEEDLLSQVNGVNKDFNLSTSPATGSLLLLMMDGLVQRNGLDYAISSDVVHMTTAPASDTYSVFVQYSTQSTAGGGGGIGGISSRYPVEGIGSIGDPIRVNSSSVTLLGPTIDPTEVPLLATQVQFGILSVSTESLQTQINAIPGTMVSTPPILGNGSAIDPFRLDSSSVTLLGPSIDSADVSFNYAGSASKGGPASTALALNSNPTDCVSGFSNAIDASGNLTCSTNGSSLTSLSVSSYTMVPSSIFTNTSFTTSIATVTLVTRGNTVYVMANLIFINNTANKEMAASFLVDGSPPAQFSGTNQAVGICNTPLGTVRCSVNFSEPVYGLAAGSHTFSLMVFTSGSQGTLLNDASYHSSFLVRETP